MVEDKMRENRLKMVLACSLRPIDATLRRINSLVVKLIFKGRGRSKKTCLSSELKAFSLTDIIALDRT